MLPALRQTNRSPGCACMMCSGTIRESAHEIISAIAAYGDMIRAAADKREPSVITRHAIDIAELFNKYYIDNRILNAEEGVKNARLALTFAVKQVISNSLALLGISVPDKM